MTAARDPLSRARDDLEAGRLWKARDRLTGLFPSRPADQELLSLLGEVYFRTGDLPQAGRHWFLTGRSGSDVEAAERALRERYRTPEARFEFIPVRARLESYPPPVQDRLRRLADEGRRPWTRWTRPEPGAHRRSERIYVPQTPPLPLSARLFGAAVLAVAVLVVVVPWVLGVAAAAYLLWRLATAIV